MVEVEEGATSQKKLKNILAGICSVHCVLLACRIALTGGEHPAEDSGTLSRSSRPLVLKNTQGVFWLSGLQTKKAVMAAAHVCHCERNMPTPGWTFLPGLNVSSWRVWLRWVVKRKKKKLGWDCTKQHIYHVQQTFAESFNVQPEIWERVIYVQSWWKNLHSATGSSLWEGFFLVSPRSFSSYSQKQRPV